MRDIKGFVKSNVASLLFGAFLIGFILLKMPHLSLPFFWDESGVYGKMIYHLADSGLSLHPKTIDQWISRGHPLLYPNIIAGACYIFGTTVTVAHSANFLITLLLILSMFGCLGKAIHPWIGLIACTLLMAQPIFFTQSVFVLPEIALAFFLWWTTWFFIQKKYILYFISGAAAVLTKEPAIVWIASLFLWDVWINRKSISWKILLWLTPLIPFFIFLYVQKTTYGWYFFPYHTGAIDLKVASVSVKLKDYLVFLFWKDGRMVWTFILLIVLSISLFQRHKKTTEVLNPLQDNRYYSALFAGAIYLVFSSTSFYGERYSLCVLPLVTSFVAFISYHHFLRQKFVFMLILLAGMTAISFLNMSSDSFNYDNDMSYTRSVASSKKTIRYLLEHNMLVQDQFSATMPIIFALADTRFGYLPADSLARHSKALHEGSKYAIQVIPGTPIENPDQRPLKLLEEWYDQDIITRVYQVQPLDTSQISKDQLK